MVTCLLCKGDTSHVLDLGKTPLANELPNGGQQEKFPLCLVQCKRCQHLQLDHHVPPERLYREYVYVSDTSQANRDYFAGYARAMETAHTPDFVVDVGGNDGLFASLFGCDSLVVDPAENIQCKVPKVTALFDETVAEGIVREHGSADLITCNNCFAHNADLSPILRGVKALLRERGTFVFEVAWAVPMLERGLFDLIYHEHVHHWTVQAAIPFLSTHGLEVYDAEDIDTHGGSIRIYARHKAGGFKRSSTRMPYLLGVEARKLPRLVSQFRERVEVERAVVQAWFGTKPGPVSLLGYPAKACTLLGYWGIGNDIHHVFDDNPRKIGKRTHFGQTIAPTSELDGDHVLIASWNYADELRARFPGHKYLTPHPFRAEQ